MNILIVDDEEVLRDVLSSLVRREGWNPLSARTGEEALRILEHEEVDLVLLDLMLPGMSGMEVMKQLYQRNPDQVVVIKLSDCAKRAKKADQMGGPVVLSRREAGKNRDKSKAEEPSDRDLRVHPEGSVSL